ncbi:MAG TPA: hypothetical protein VM534_06525 [Thermoanaerobaculia bacterium]|nr:hypothetical protein [Thermoanaerobaculia bacterium]
MIWRERKWLLLVLGALLAANAIFFLTYRIRYEERVEGLEEDLAEAQAELTSIQTERKLAESTLARYRDTALQVTEVYDDWWATPRERLAPLIIELRELARSSELVPQVRNYSYQQSTGANPITAHPMTISFAVSGSYAQVRRLINLIELSDHYIVIDQIGLTDAKEGGARLNLDLRLKTLFRSVEPADREGAGV